MPVSNENIGSRPYLVIPETHDAGAITAAYWPPSSPTSGLTGIGAVMRPVLVKAGHVAARHHHEFEQFLFVSSGGGQLECEAGSIPLRPGTALHLPAGAWHAAVFDSNTVLIELNLHPQT